MSSRPVHHINISRHNGAEESIRFRGTIFYILIACTSAELLLFLWLASFGYETFMTFVTEPDTESYISVARQLVQNATLIASPRTLGYPLFLSLGYFAGGMRYGIYIVIAMQLILNIVFLFGFWRLLQHLAPDAKTKLKISITLLFFWAGIGMAFDLISDFLAAFFFGLFLYGMLFWRSWSSVFLTGISLALATLIRPTFTFVPFLIPIAAYFIGRFTSKVPRLHILIFVILSLMATGVSVIYQYSSYGYTGPSNIVTKNIGRILHYALTGHEITKDGYERFNAKIAEYANIPYNDLSERDKEKYAIRIFLNELSSKPGVVIGCLFKTFFKYIFVPIEAFVGKLAVLYESEQLYFTYVRPILALVCLPLWLLSLIPPVGLPKKKAYYLLVIMFLVYVVGVTVINPLQGERIRFPMLAFMLSVMVWNVQRVSRSIHSH
jgi:hypothetical protein